MTVTLEQKGLSQTLQLLRSLENQKQAVNILRQSTRKAAVPYIQGLERSVPFDSDDTDGYHLRDAMRVQLEKKRNRETAVQFRVGPAREVDDDPNTPYRIRGGLGFSIKSPNYAGLVEKDTQFMSKTFASKSRQVLQVFAKEARTRVIKAIKKAQRKTIKK